MAEDNKDHQSRRTYTFGDITVILNGIIDDLFADEIRIRAEVSAESSANRLSNMNTRRYREVTHPYYQKQRHQVNQPRQRGNGYKNRNDRRKC